MDGQVVNDKKAIANMFDNVFTNVGIKLENHVFVPPEHNCTDY